VCTSIFFSFFAVRRSGTSRSGKQRSIFLQEQGTGRKLGLLRAWLYAHSLRSQTACGGLALLESRVQSFNLPRPSAGPRTKNVNRAPQEGFSAVRPRAAVATMGLSRLRDARVGSKVDADRGANGMPIHTNNGSKARSKGREGWARRGAEVK
jgi:hypothetical protein